jgi:hypothetical protein
MNVIINDTTAGLAGSLFRRPGPGLQMPERDLGINISHLTERNTARLSISEPVTEVHNDFKINAF